MSDQTVSRSKLWNINPQLLKIYIIISCVVLLLALGFAYSLVRLALDLDTIALAWWASLATMTLPLALILGVYIGLQVSKLIMKGVDLGAGKITEAATKSIDLRGQSAAMARMATTPAPDHATIQGFLVTPDLPAQGGSLAQTVGAAELEGDIVDI